MRNFPAITLLIAAFSLLACGGETKTPVDRSKFETPVTEAVLKHILKQIPTAKKEEAQIAFIGLGDRLSDSASSAFWAKFSDEPLKFLDGSTFEPTVLVDRAIVVDRKTRLTPLTLHVSAIESFPDDTHRVTAAWAYKSEMARKLFRASTDGAGGYTVEELETLKEEPVPAP